MLSCHVSQEDRLEMKTFPRSWVYKWARNINTIGLPLTPYIWKICQLWKEDLRNAWHVDSCSEPSEQGEEGKEWEEDHSASHGKTSGQPESFCVPVLCLTFWAHTDKELKGQPCVNWILFCSGRHAFPGQAGSSPSAAGDSKISDIWGAG